MPVRVPFERLSRAETTSRVAAGAARCGTGADLVVEIAQPGDGGRDGHRGLRGWLRRRLPEEGVLARRGGAGEERRRDLLVRFGSEADPP